MFFIKKYLSHTKKELETEVRDDGVNVVIERLALEKAHLIALQKHQKEHEAVLSECTERIFARGPQAHDSFSAFWKEQQTIINSKSSRADREVLAEKIDWLKAREYLSKEMALKAEEKSCTR